MKAVFVLVVVCILSFVTVALTSNVTSDDRIVGGFITSIHFHKHLVQVLYMGTPMGCGGSLVSKRHVVTAAHCIIYDPDSPRRYGIKAGSTYLSQPGTERKVERMWMHHKYKESGNDYDIALFKLFNPISGPLIEPIPLGTKRLKDGDFVNVAGWGYTREGSVESDHLRAVFVKVVSRARCNAMYGGGISVRMLCAGKEGKDACQGDSGGPLIRDGKLYGVVSWGRGCARPNSPGVYANVVQLRNFVINKMKL